MRESQVEAHLKAVVKKLGGETRKVKWIGRNGAPDRFVMLPTQWGLTGVSLAPPLPVKKPSCFWVELKAPKKGPTAQQAREHARLRNCGQEVVVLDSVEAVDEYFKVMT